MLKSSVETFFTEVEGIEALLAQVAQTIESPSPSSSPNSIKITDIRDELEQLKTEIEELVSLKTKVDQSRHEQSQLFVKMEKRISQLTPTKMEKLRSLMSQ